MSNLSLKCYKKSPSLMRACDFFILGKEAISFLKFLK